MPCCSFPKLLFREDRRRDRVPRADDHLGRHPLRPVRPQHPNQYQRHLRLPGASFQVREESVPYLQIGLPGSKGGGKKFTTVEYSNGEERYLVIREIFTTYSRYFFLHYSGVQGANVTVEHFVMWVIHAQFLGKRGGRAKQR